MTYTPPSRPQRMVFCVTLAHTTGVYNFIATATSPASAILKARTELADALNIDHTDDAIRVVGVALTGGTRRV